MSGIAGMVRFDGANADSSLIEAMVAAMPHRAVDGHAHWAKGPAALGECLFHTTAEALTGDHPAIHPERGLVVVFDGRLDNWEELRRAIEGKGIAERNRSDSEILLNAYELWGEECIARLDGDFAFALWDWRNRKLLCARDRTASRPFFYRHDKRGFFFASEIRPLYDLPGAPCRLNEGRLAQFLADELITLDETPWAEISQLPAGHAMVVNERGVVVRRYWDPRPGDLPNLRTLDDHAAYYRHLLFDLVRRSTRSHRPLAFEVSGGLDSSALFVVAAELKRNGTLLAPDVTGWTLSFPPGHGPNEIAYARDVARKADLPLREVPPTEFTPADHIALGHRERDFGELPSGAMSIGLREAVKEDGALALVGGVGGDEWLGDPWFQKLFYVEQLLSGDLLGLARSFGAERRDFGTRRALMKFLRFGLWPFVPPAADRAVRSVRDRLRGFHQERIADHFLSPDLRERLEAARVVKADQRPSRRYGRERKVGFASHPYTSWGWPRVVQTAATQGVEVRAPLRSATIAEWSMAVPSKYMTVGKWDRMLHRYALRDLLPDSVYSRDDKGDFADFIERQVARPKDYFDDVTKRRRQWFGERTPADLHRALQAPGQNLDDLPRLSIVWALGVVMAADGLLD